MSPWYSRVKLMNLFYQVTFRCRFKKIIIIICSIYYLNCGRGTGSSIDNNYSGRGQVTHDLVPIRPVIIPIMDHIVGHNDIGAHDKSSAMMGLV